MFSCECSVGLILLLDLLGPLKSETSFYFIYFIFSKGLEITTLIIYLIIYLALPGLSCHTRDLHCGVRDLLVPACRIFSCGMWDPLP